LQTLKNIFLNIQRPLLVWPERSDRGCGIFPTSAVHILIFTCLLPVIVSLSHFSSFVVLSLRSELSIIYTSFMLEEIIQDAQSSFFIFLRRTRLYSTALLLLLVRWFKQLRYHGCSVCNQPYCTSNIVTTDWFQ
jgi:hypothetical protein